MTVGLLDLPDEILSQILRKVFSSPYVYGEPNRTCKILPP